jgi:hypothetical protein
MDPAAITELIKLGLPGIVILALAYAYLRKDNKIDEINEKRIAEARESVKAIEQSTNALEGLTDILRDRKAGQ